METLGLALNLDDGIFFGSRTADEMTMEGLLAFVDQYAGTQVSHLFFCPNAQRTSYRSKVWENFWEIGNQQVVETIATGGGGAKWIEHARLLDERGLNPFTVWTQRCHEVGISPWLSMRMNDVHDSDIPSSFLNSSFRVQHPEYWRVPNTGDPHNWGDRAFDYAHAEVREHHMKLVRELLEMYDLDGLELDWMRFGYHFKPGHEQEGSDILCEFMREVRSLANQAAVRWGHPVKVGVRVPAQPTAAIGMGMDGIRWAKEGSIDLLVVTPFYGTADFDIPIELWRGLLGSANDNVVLAAGLENNIRSYIAEDWAGAACVNDIESVCGFTAAHLDRGADQIYLFNYFDANISYYPALLNEAGRLQTAAAKPRRHVQTYVDTWPPGVVRPFRLPATLEGTCAQQFRLYTGPIPASGRVAIRAGLHDGPGVSEAQISARLNSAECRTLSDGDPELFMETIRMIQFDVPLAAMHRGYNLVELFINGGLPQQIVWVEIRIDPTEN